MNDFPIGRPFRQHLDQRPVSQFCLDKHGGQLSYPNPRNGRRAQGNHAVRNKNFGSWRNETCALSGADRIQTRSSCGVPCDRLGHSARSDGALGRPYLSIRAGLATNQALPAIRENTHNQIAVLYRRLTDPDCQVNAFSDRIDPAVACLNEHRIADGTN